jgi:hypothetical protein
MTIQEFARRNRLKTKSDKADDTNVIVGKTGLIYEYSLDGSLLAVMFITPATKPPRTYMWRKTSMACVRAGMTMRQKGDAEGVLSFDPENADQIRLALKLAGVKRKRKITPKQLARLARFGFKARKAAVGGPISS